jgi:hypothetical protein
MRILIILDADAGGQAGVGIEGLIEAYYLFQDASLEVVVAAPGGGSAGEPTGAAAAVQRFKADRPTRDVMNDLLDLAAVCPDDFDAALCLRAFRLDSTSGRLISLLLVAAKPVAVIADLHDGGLPETGDGLLLIGKGAEASRLAANALLGALRALLL